MLFFVLLYFCWILVEHGQNCMMPAAFGLSDVEFKCHVK